MYDDDNYDEHADDEFQDDVQVEGGPSNSRSGGPNAAVGAESQMNVGEDCTHDDEPQHVDPFHSEKGGSKTNVGRRIPGKDIVTGGNSNYAIRSSTQDSQSPDIGG